MHGPERRLQKLRVPQLCSPEHKGASGRQKGQLRPPMRGISVAETRCSKFKGNLERILFLRLNRGKVISDY